MSTSEAPIPDAAALALGRMVAARVTHDLGSPLGTLSGILDLLDKPDRDLLTVAREAAATLRARLRLQAAAWGEGVGSADAESLAGLLGGSPAAPRVRFGFAGPLFAAPVPGPLVPLVLNGALLAAEALPRGGEVRVSGTDRDLVFLPDGRNVGWPAEVVAACGQRLGDALAAGPRRVVAPLLMGMAAEQGFDVALAPGIGPGAMALVLARR